MRRSRRDRGEGPGPPPPPSDDDGRGDGWDDGDGGGDDQHRPGDGNPPGTALFALRLALISITTLFLVFLGVWLLLSRRVEAGREVPAPPESLWISTAVLLGSSYALARAVRSAKLTDVRRWLGISLALGVGFLIAQLGLWSELYRSGVLPSSHGYGAFFYLLTILHAMHVVVGLGYLMWLYTRLRERRPRKEMIDLGATYWHFMGGIWVVLFVVLYFVR